MSDSKRQDNELCNIEGCHVNENGLCALHGVEVERRKNTERRLNSMDSTLQTINNKLDSAALKIDTIGEKQSNMKTASVIVSWLAAVVITAAFVYPTLIWKSGETNHRLIETYVLSNSRAVASMTETMNHVVQRMDRLSKTIETQNNLLKEHEDKTKKAIPGWGDL